jgi:hypothetical protein
MSRYVIENSETIQIKKLLKKFGELSINNSRINGTIVIKNYRKYLFSQEIDIEFKGQIFAVIHGDKKTWFGSDSLNNSELNLSKIKVNRYLKKNALTDIQMRMRYFGVELGNYQSISKVKWI